MPRGLFVTFEGCEGAGKSAHVKMLNEKLTCERYRVRCLREPGGTPVGEKLRDILKIRGPDINLCSEAELLIINASRCQIVRDLIVPALNEGEIVLCDRFYDSSIAYQGYGRGLDLKKVNEVIDFATNGIKPDITFFIDIEPEKGLSNINERNYGTKDAFDDLDIEFHRRVYRGFQSLAQKETQRIVTVPYLHGEFHKMNWIMYDKIIRKLGQKS